MPAVALDAQVSMSDSTDRLGDEEPDAQRRFGGMQRLYGMDGAKAIRNAHVAVVGIGGVGSWAAEALARSGVGKLTLIDLDHVAESNINRQVHALTQTLGQAKVQAMRERIAQINPDCEVRCVEEFVDADNWPGLLEGSSLDGLIDACDQLQAKLAMALWARHALRIQPRSRASPGCQLCADEYRRQSELPWLRLQRCSDGQLWPVRRGLGDGPYRAACPACSLIRLARSPRLAIQAKTVLQFKASLHSISCLALSQDQVLSWCSGLAEPSCGTLAQLVEQRTFNPLVTSSNLVRPTN